MWWAIAICISCVVKGLVLYETHSFVSTCMIIMPLSPVLNGVTSSIIERSNLFNFLYVYNHPIYWLATCVNTIIIWFNHDYCFIAYGCDGASSSCQIILKRRRLAIGTVLLGPENYPPQTFLEEGFHCTCT